MLLSVVSLLFCQDDFDKDLVTQCQNLSFIFNRLKIYFGYSRSRNVMTMMSFNILLKDKTFQKVPIFFYCMIIAGRYRHAQWQQFNKKVSFNKTEDIFTVVNYTLFIYFKQDTTYD